jgi:hypothetical protein
MGFSKRGFVALYSSMRRFQRVYGPANTEFAAYIPFMLAAFSNLGGISI